VAWDVQGFARGGSRGNELPERHDFCMWAQQQTLATDPAEWLGHWHPLAAQLGSADGLVALAALTAALNVPPIGDLPSLRQFIRAYHDRVLRPIELPAILRAFRHTSVFELRELIAFDQELTQCPELQPLAPASRRVGRAHLEQLRPLRDDRFVRRYLDAVDEGRANAWHTLVYGLTLSVYSLPLRQGLVSYAAQTTRGFIHLSAAGLNCRESDCRMLFDEVCGEISIAAGELTKAALPGAAVL
jgi:urease accessory protein UreF